MIKFLQWKKKNLITKDQNILKAFDNKYIPGKTSRRRDENEEYGGGEGEYGEGGGDEEGEQLAGGYSYVDEGEGEGEQPAGGYSYGGDEEGEQPAGGYSYGGDEEGEQPAGGYSYGDEGEGEAEEALWWDYLLNEYKCNSQKENLRYLKLNNYNVII